MKILHISSALTWRGGEQQIAYLLEELQGKQVQSFLLCPQGSALNRWVIDKEIDTVFYQKTSSISLKIPKTIKNLCRSKNIDLIHIHDSHAHGYVYLAYLLASLKTPSVLSRRVDFPISYFSKWKYNHPKIKKIICVSNCIKTVLLPRITNPSKLAVVHSGVDLSRLSKEKSNFFRTTFDIPEDYMIVGNIAAIAPHKDYETFVKTVNEYKSKYNQNIKWLIIGKDAGQRDFIEKMIVDFGLQNDIILTGFIPEVYRYISGLDAMLVTSQEEGLGTSIIDAMGSRVPIVTTDAGGIPELIEHNKNGLVAPVNDYKLLSQHIDTILLNKELSHTLVANGLKKSLHFNKKKTTKNTWDIYKEILGK